MRATADSPIAEAELQARVDGRLPAERAEAVEAYLDRHPEVRERLSQYAEQRQALRAIFADQENGPMPARLQVARLIGARRQRHWRQLANLAAVILLLVLGGIAGWTARELLPGVAPSTSAAFTRAVLDSAIAAYRTFSVETRHPVEVGANEEAHLVQWLSKRLGHRLIAPDLGALGFRLIGGRLLSADTGPAALFMYEDGKGVRLTCYYLSVDGGGDAEFKYREQNGVGAFYWLEDGLAYAIAANADRDLLLKVAEIIYQQNSPDGARAKIPPVPGKPS